MSFDIRKHLDTLTSDGGSHNLREASYHCPVCGSKNFKVDLETGEYGTYGCNCATIPQGKRKIRDAIAPAKWDKPLRPKQRREWVYPDLEGNPVVRVYRTDDGNGKRRIWQKSLVKGKQPKDLDVAPYRYHECLKALKQGADYIFHVEGESCADALWAEGIPATTTLGGSNGYRPEIHAGLFPSDRLVICPDQDIQGLKYAEAIAADYPDAKWLYANPGSYLWLRLPQSGGFDVADWIENGATTETILAAIEPRRTFKPDKKSQSEPIADEDDSPKLARKFKAVKRIWGDNLRFNELTNQLELNGEPVEDVADLRLTLALDYGLSVPLNDCEVIIKRIAKDNAYHPVAKYLEECFERHGNCVEILENLASQLFGTTGPIYETFLKKTLVAAVARIFEPGCKVDTALILNGPQGLRKSSFFQTLVGAGWFDDSMGAATSERDERLKLHQFWILEWGELEAVFRRKDISAVKSFLSCPVDTVRPPYGRTAISLKRRSTIVGSTNQDEFLTDPTGNRRFWVIPVQQRIPLEKVAALRDKIWAAAVYLYRSGYQWWLSQDEEAIAAEFNKSYHTEDPWISVVSSYLRHNHLRETTTADLLKHALEIPAGQQNKGHEMRLGEVLRDLGWTGKRINRAGKRVRGWIAPKVVPEVVQEQDAAETHTQQSMQANPVYLSTGQPGQLNLEAVPEAGQPEILSQREIQASGTTWTTDNPKRDQKTENGHSLPTEVKPLSDRELALLVNGGAHHDA